MCGPLIKILIISLKFKGKKKGQSSEIFSLEETCICIDAPQNEHVLCVLYH